jgi:hypothetical protein
MIQIYETVRLREGISDYIARILHCWQVNMEEWFPFSAVEEELDPTQVDWLVGR